MYSTRKTLEKLFISKVRIKVLKYFLLHPDKPIHLRAAVREFDEEINAVRRELERLESVKMLIAEKKGNRKYFQTDKAHPYFDELLPLFHKAYGLGGEIMINENKIGRIEFALLTNAYAKNNRQGQNDVDMLLVGDINLDVVAEIINKFEQKDGREIHYTILKSTEFNLRKKRKDAFVLDILMQPKIMLLGKAEELIANIN
jgi:hypothetical protein